MKAKLLLIEVTENPPEFLYGHLDTKELYIPLYQISSVNLNYNFSKFQLNKNSELKFYVVFYSRIYTHYTVHGKNSIKNVTFKGFTSKLEALKFISVLVVIDIEADYSIFEYGYVGVKLGYQQNQ